MSGSSDLPAERRAALNGGCGAAGEPPAPVSGARVRAGACEPGAVGDAGAGNYRDVAVRDLAWLLQSAPLLNRERFGDLLAQPLSSCADRGRAAAWLATLDADPLPLHDMLRARPQSRLGLYAEQLLTFFFEHGPGLRLVAANRAVRVDGHTLGECDFLLEGPDGCALHWELAVKCYLYAGGPATSLAQYVGPNLADRFDLKLDRLLTHQLPLSAHPQIAALAHGRVWRPAMLVRGWLFYRWARDSAADVATGALPLAPEHTRGWWTTAAEWPPFDAPAWMIVPRLRWMAPLRFARADDPAVLRNPMDVLPNCTDYWRHRPDQPLMAAALAPENDVGDTGDGGLREVSRGFIVPDDWPAHARAYAATPGRDAR
jgi:hypothetical protein